MKKSVIAVALLIIILLFAYMIADRITPYASNGRVKAMIVPLVPEVSGRVVELFVGHGKMVQANDLLAKLDAQPFEIARDKAEAALEQAMQDMGAGSAGVLSAQANVSRQQAKYENARVQYQRTFQLAQQGLVAKSKADDEQAALLESESALAQAKADLQRAKQQLGPEGETNPAIKRAMAELAQAELNLQHTQIVAPSVGGITDVVIAPGTYAASGKPILTFIDTGNIWVEAYFTENNIGNIDVGDSAEVVLDVHPGRVFKGRVLSIAGATADSSDTQPGTLTAAPKQSGWLQDPQRIPVRIALSGYEVGDHDDDVRFQINGRADAIIYTGRHPLFNLFGKIVIRLASLVSYAY